MPKAEVKTIDGQVVAEMELPEEIFAVPYNPFLIQEIVTMQMACRRRGTHKAKGRAEIAGSMKKLYRQKGTGHARPGTVKSPLRRGGGVVFGPTPRDYSFSPPKKVKRAALRVALSKKLGDGMIEIVREFQVDEPRTKPLLSKLDPEKNGIKTLIVSGTLEEETHTNLRKSLKNVSNYKVLKAEGLNVYDLLKYKRIILLETSIPLIEKRLG